MNRNWVLVGAILLLSGCATTKNFELILNSWVGDSISNYMATNSVAPVQVVSDDYGGKIYFFDYSSTGYYTTPTTTNAQATVYGNTAYGMATTYGGQTIPILNQCTWTFSTDSRGTITRWSYRGNACKANAPK